MLSVVVLPFFFPAFVFGGSLVVFGGFFSERSAQALDVSLKARCAPSSATSTLSSSSYLIAFGHIASITSPAAHSAGAFRADGTGDRSSISPCGTIGVLVASPRRRIRKEIFHSLAARSRTPRYVHAPLAPQGSVEDNRPPPVCSMLPLSCSPSPPLFPFSPYPTSLVLARICSPVPPFFLLWAIPKLILRTRAC